MRIIHEASVYVCCQSLYAFIIYCYTQEIHTGNDANDLGRVNHQCHSATSFRAFAQSHRTLRTHIY